MYVTSVNYLDEESATVLQYWQETEVMFNYGKHGKTADAAGRHNTSFSSPKSQDKVCAPPPLPRVTSPDAKRPGRGGDNSPSPTTAEFYLYDTLRDKSAFTKAVPGCVG